MQYDIVFEGEVFPGVRFFYLRQSEPAEKLADWKAEEKILIVDKTTVREFSTSLPFSELVEKSEAQIGKEKFK